MWKNGVIHEVIHIVHISRKPSIYKGLQKNGYFILKMSVL